MNRDDVINLLREATHTSNKDEDSVSHIISDETLQRFAALVAAAEREAYQNVHRLLEVHQAALEASEKPGPWPSKEVIDKAVAAEREACAKECENTTESWAPYLYDRGCLACAKAIRARDE